jgi:hypothetical protein
VISFGFGCSEKKKYFISALSGQRQQKNFYGDSRTVTVSPYITHITFRLATPLVLGSYRW